VKLESIYTVVNKLSSFRQYLQNVYSCSRLFLWGCCTLPESTHRQLVLRRWKAQVCYSRIIGGWLQTYM